MCNVYRESAPLCKSLSLCLFVFLCLSASLSLSFSLPLCLEELSLWLCTKERSSSWWPVLAPKLLQSSIARSTWLSLVGPRAKVPCGRRAAPLIPNLIRQRMNVQFFQHYIRSYSQCSCSAKWASMGTGGRTDATWNARPRYRTPRSLPDMVLIPCGWNGGRR